MIGEEYGVAKHSSLLNHDIYYRVRKIYKTGQEKEKENSFDLLFIEKKLNGFPFYLAPQYSAEWHSA